MVSLFPKYTSLNKLAYFAFTLAGFVNKEGNKWILIWMFYQWVAVFAASLTAVVELFVGSKEIKEIVQTLSAAIVSILNLSKLYLFASRRKEIRHLFERLEDIRQTSINDPEYTEVINEVETFGRKVLKGIYYSFIFFPFPSFILHTIVECSTNFKRKKLLINLWMPWSRENVWAHVLTNALIADMTLSVILVNVGFYFMEITYSFYMSTFIKILRNKLINKGIKNKHIYDDHKVIIQLIHDYNRIMSEQIYLEAVITPIVPCGFGLSFLRALQRGETGQAVDNCIKAVHCLLPTLVSCSCGQRIINEMEKLHESTLMTNWDDEKPNFRKDLLMMMTKTNKPTSINYRLFMTFNHEYFTGVLRVIYSYFMLMINLDEQ